MNDVVTTPHEHNRVVDGVVSPPLPPTTLRLRATPPTRTRTQGAILAVFAFLPAVVLPIGWFWSTKQLGFTTAIALLALAVIATIAWAMRTFWLPSSTSIIVDDKWLDLPFGRQRVRFHLDELLSLRLIKGDVIVFAAVAAGVTARGHSGAVVVPRRCFVPPVTGQTLIDDVRERLGRRHEGAARVARLDVVADQQQRHARKRPVVTWSVTSICALIFAAQQADVRVFNALLESGGNFSTAVVDGQLWRVVTANLLHASLLHVGMNIAGLIGTGALLERWLGRWAMVLVLFGSGVGGQFASTVVAVVNGAPRMTVGISAAVFGLLGVLFVSTVRFRRSPLGGMRVPLSGWLILLVTNGAISLIPIVDSVAHVGGFVAGALVGLVVVPRPDLPQALRPKVASVLGRLALAVTATAVIAWMLALLR